MPTSDPPPAETDDTAMRAGMEFLRLLGLDPTKQQVERVVATLDYAEGSESFGRLRVDVKFFPLSLTMSPEVLPPDSTALKRI